MYVVCNYTIEIETLSFTDGTYLAGKICTSTHLLMIFLQIWALLETVLTVKTLLLENVSLLF